MQNGLFLYLILYNRLDTRPKNDHQLCGDAQEVDLPNIALKKQKGDMESPQGALFLCRLPEKRSFMPHKGMLVLDGIQDPGNLGTILRTADALEIPVALLEGCADPFSHKVVRASMGAVFRSCPVQTTWAQAQEALRCAGIPVGVTALSPRAVDLRTARLDQMALVIGSEGRGVRSEVLDAADQELIIPMNPNCESLNAAVAATIVMWQIKCS